MKSKKLFIFLSCFGMLTLFMACNSDATSEPPQADPNAPCPKFSPAGGFYKEAQQVSITCEDSTEIYYTVLEPALNSDGSWNEEQWKANVASSFPSETSTKYAGPFEVKKQCVIRAVAKKSNGTKNYAMTSFDFDLDRTTDFTGQWKPVSPESEDWQDQTIYFILTDRFFNGDTTNDRIPNLKTQTGEPYDESKVLEGQPASGYNGGDIEGIRQKLDYIKDLGFTAIWMTPPVKCQVAESNYHGYHGYWASDFTKVDPHMGTLQQYQNFVKEAHEKGLYVIQDIVVNHLGDYQQIKKDISANDFVEGKAKISESRFYLEPKSVPFSHPEQLPWALNNINDLTYDEWKHNSFYHYNSEISDYTNQTNMYTHSSSNLDDMVTESEVVRNLLRGYFRYWIDKTGIDGYRIDTALYVEPEFFEGFINDTDASNMGVREYGKSKGKADFIDFGEAFSQDEKVCGSYTRSNPGDYIPGTPRMDSMLYFPLRYAIADSISSGGKTDVISKILGHRYSMDYYQNPSRLVTFIDNHDMDRWGHTMKGGSELMKIAYGIIYTIEGIPQVYYGSEQGFSGECREGMFTGSFKAPGLKQTSDHFDTTGDWYKYFQQLNKMRKENRVFRHNIVSVIQDTKDSAGVFAYVIRERDPAEPSKFLDGLKNKALFVTNSSETDKLLNASSLYLKDGEKYKLVPYNGVSVCAAGGNIEGELLAVGESSDKAGVRAIVPAKSCAIYLLEQTGVPTGSSVCTLTVDEVPSEKIKDATSISIKGTTNNTGKVKIVLNGDYSSAKEVDATANVQFSQEIDIAGLSNGTISVQLVQVVGTDPYFSSSKFFIIERPFKLIKKYSDPVGDDNGVGVAKGILQHPTDKPFDGTMDIQGVDVYRSGNDILLGVRMGAISHGWNPTSNLFDHVIFNLFISDGDDTTGCAAQPNCNYTLPAAFGKWDYMFLAQGWGQTFCSSDNASATNSGTVKTPSPKNDPPVAWDKIDDNAVPNMEKYSKPDWSSYNPAIGDEFADKPGMIWFKISAASIGFPKNLASYKFYLNTWDFDMGNPRGVKDGDAERYKFGSGSLKASEIPTVCDETDEIITLN